MPASRGRKKRSASIFDSEKSINNRASSRSFEMSRALRYRLRLRIEHDVMDNRWRRKGRRKRLAFAALAAEAQKRFFVATRFLRAYRFHSLNVLSLATTLEKSEPIKRKGKTRTYVRV